jgi:holliday junction DNA helicase RuvA
MITTLTGRLAEIRDDSGVLASFGTREDGNRVLAASGARRAIVLPGDGATGLGLEVLVPAYFADAIMSGEAAGSGEWPTITLHTMLYLEQQGQGATYIPRLLGFGSHQERAFFELLTSVKGLGNKRALRALALPPSLVARMIIEEDIRGLTRLPEIGKKLAETIVLELREKAEPFASTSAVPPPLPPAQAAIEPKASGKRRQPASQQPGGATPSTSGVDVLVVRRLQRETVEALIALGESALDAERMVQRVVERARASGDQLPTTPADMLTAAFASRG